MSELLPSELARLVLGYFESKGYSKTAETMLNELPELSEINHRRRKGRKVNLRVGDLCLTDLLDDYSTSKDIILENIEKHPATFTSVKKIQSLADQVNALIEMALKSKTFKFYPRNLYRNRSDTQTPKLTESPDSLNLSHNISITVGDYVDPNYSPEKRFNVDTTPESSLPGSSKRENPSLEEPDTPLLEKSKKENRSFTPDVTPQKRKGSLRKKSQPSPKILSKTGLHPEGDEKMEKLLKNLIDNTALHQKIAENINKTLFSTSGGTGDAAEALPSTEDASQVGQAKPTSHNLNFNISPNHPTQNAYMDSVLDGDVSLGSKTSLPDNIISNLSLQVTNDPMVESILASLDCEPQTISSSSSIRLLTTPVPPLSPSHSNLSLSSSMFSSFQPCTSMQDILSQPMTQPSNFTLEQCFQNQDSSQAVKPLNALQRIDNVNSSSFPTSFPDADRPVLNKDSDTPSFRNDKETVPCNLPNKSQDDNACPSKRQNDLGLPPTENIESTEKKEIIAGSSESAIKPVNQINLSNSSHQSSKSEIGNPIYPKSNETSRDQLDTRASTDSVATLMKEIVNNSDSRVPCASSSSDSLENQTDVNSLKNCKGSPPKRPIKKIKPTFISNDSVKIAVNMFNFDEDSLADDCVEGGNSTSQNYMWPRTPQHVFLVPQSAQNFSPMRPPSVRAVPAVNSNDEFMNSTYFSGTPDHPSNYTFTELTPLPPVTQEWGNPIINPVASTSDNLEPTKASTTLMYHQTTNETPTQSSPIPVNTFTSNNTDGTHLVAHPEEEVISRGTVATEEYYGSKILKVPGYSEESSIVVVQMPYQNPNLHPILPKPEMTFEEQRKEEIKCNYNKLHRKRPIKISSGNKRAKNKNSAAVQTQKKNKENRLTSRTKSSNHIKELLTEAIETASRKRLPPNRASEENEGGEKPMETGKGITPTKNLKKDKKEREGEKRRSSRTSHTETNDKNHATTASHSVSDKKNCEIKSKLEELLKNMTARQPDLEHKGESSEKETSFNLPLSENDPVLLNSNMDMEDLVDELENRNIEDVSVVKSNQCSQTENGQNNFGENASNKSDLKLKRRNLDNASNSFKSWSPQLKSLISFSKNFVLKSNLGKNVNSPLSNEKILSYKGSLSTPRNKKEHVRVLDFNTPRKVLSSRKRSPRARSSLQFCSPSPHKEPSLASKKNKLKRTKKGSPRKKCSLDVILEDAKEGGSSHFTNSVTENLSPEKKNSLSTSRDPRFSMETNEPSDEVDKILLQDVEADLFLSEDESHTSNVTPFIDKVQTNNSQLTVVENAKDASSLQTPGKESCVPVCLELATPFPLNGPATVHQISIASELNTPLPPLMAVTPSNKSPYLKAYPQGPYSDSSEGTYYQPSERSVTESEVYSPLQDDIENVLIRTAQKSEIELAKLLPQQPEESKEKEREDNEVETTNKDEGIEGNNPVLEELLKNRPKYKLRKMTNEQLGEVVEQEMQFYKKMQSLFHSNQSQNDDGADGESINNDKERLSKTEANRNQYPSFSRSGQGPKPRVKGKARIKQLQYEGNKSTSKQVKTQTSSRSNKSNITFESFGCDIEILKMHTLAILRDSHIESSQPLLKCLLELLEKEEECTSKFSRENIIRFFLELINYYASPSMLRSMKKQIKTSIPTQNYSSTIKKPKSANENFTKTSSSTQIEKRAKTSTVTKNAKGQNSHPEVRKGRAKKRTEETIRSTKDLDMTIDVVECEIEALVVNSTENQNGKLDETFEEPIKVEEFSPLNERHVKNILSEKYNDSSLEESENEYEVLCKMKQSSPTFSYWGKDVSPSKESPTASKTTSPEELRNRWSALSKLQVKNEDKLVSHYPQTVSTRSDHVEEETETNQEAKLPSEGCARMVNFKGSPLYTWKSRSSTKEFGCIINITPKRNKMKVEHKRRLKCVESIPVSSPENSRSSTVEIMEDKTPLQEESSLSPTSCVQRDDDYSNIERQLAELDGSVVNSPAIREELLCSTMDEENISVMFTPSSQSHEGNVVEFYSQKMKESVSFETPTKLNPKSLISFTPLPGTPEKQVEEICQTVVKNKVALVAFPSLLEEGTSEGLDKELSKRVKDVSKKVLKNKGRSDSHPPEGGQNISNYKANSLRTPSPHNEVIATEQNETPSQTERQIDLTLDTSGSIVAERSPEESEAYCSLSFSGTFDLLSLNLELRINHSSSEELDHSEKKTSKDNVTNSKGNEANKLTQSEFVAEPRVERSLFPQIEMHHNGVETAKASKLYQEQVKKQLKFAHETLEVMEKENGSERSRKRGGNIAESVCGTSSSSVCKSTSSCLTSTRKRRRSQKERSDDTRGKARKLIHRTEDMVDACNKSTKGSNSDARILSERIASTPCESSEVMNDFDAERLIANEERGKRRKYCDAGVVKKGITTSGTVGSSNIDLDDTESLEELQLSSSDTDVNEDDSSNNSTTEKLPSGAKGVTKSLVEGGAFELSESPKKLQTFISKFPSQENFLHLNEESMCSIPPTPGKYLSFPTCLNFKSTERHESRASGLHAASSSVSIVSTIRSQDQTCKSNSASPVKKHFKPSKPKSKEVLSKSSENNKPSTSRRSTRNASRKQIPSNSELNPALNEKKLLSKLKSLFDESASMPEPPGDKRVTRASKRNNVPAKIESKQSQGKSLKKKDDKTPGSESVTPKRMEKKSNTKLDDNLAESVTALTKLETKDIKNLLDLIHSDTEK